MKLYLTLSLLLVLMACQNTSKETNIGEEETASVSLENNNNLDSVFTKNEVEGTMVIYKLLANEWIYVNDREVNSGFVPASTFKIYNSLIGLETGVIEDENFEIPWDGVEYWLPAWNKTHSLASAFKVSCLPYYRELARRVGEPAMKMWIDSIGYGNQDIRPAVDSFWVGNYTTITTREQVDLLVKLYKEELPFSKRNMDIVKKIMIAEEGEDYTLRAKTGWGITPTGNVGWYVGWWETEEEVYFFANCIQKEDREGFREARIDIAKTILNEYIQ